MKKVKKRKRRKTNRKSVKKRKRRGGNTLRDSTPSRATVKAAVAALDMQDVEETVDVFMSCMSSDATAALTVARLGVESLRVLPPRLFLFFTLFLFVLRLFLFLTFFIVLYTLLSKLAI